MKKILIVLGILILICVNCAFADNDITVLDTLNNANNNTVNAVVGFNDIMSHTISYIKNGAITSFNGSIHKFILYPTNISYSGDIVTTTFIFQFIDKSASGTWGVISQDNTDSFWFPNSYYDLVIGYTINNGVYTYEIECQWNINSDSYVFSNELFTRINDVDFSHLWKITGRNIGSINTYSLVSQWKNINQWNGIYFSIWSSETFLPTYYGYYAGWDTSNWDRRYTKNVDLVVPIYRSDIDVNDNASLDVIVNDSGITIPTNDADIEGLDNFNISNIEKLWEKVKSLVLGLISQLKGVVYLFGSIFSWLPQEIVALVVSGLLFGVIILIIHFIRGK